MGLVVCKQCQGPVADNAPHCPHCGAPQASGGEASFVVFLRELWKQDTTQKQLPPFLGAALGVGVVLLLHEWLDRPGVTIDTFTICWQIALGALVGFLLGALITRR